MHGSRRVSLPTTTIIALSGACASPGVSAAPAVSTACFAHVAVKHTFTSQNPTPLLVQVFQVVKRGRELSGGRKTKQKSTGKREKGTTCACALDKAAVQLVIESYFPCHATCTCCGTTNIRYIESHSTGRRGRLTFPKVVCRCPGQFALHASVNSRGHNPMGPFPFAFCGPFRVSWVTSRRGSFR